MPARQAVLSSTAFPVYYILISTDSIMNFYETYFLETYMSKIK